MIVGIVSVILIYLFVGFCKICRKRESLWIFILVAVGMIPFNIYMIRSVLSYIGNYTDIRWFVKLGVYPLLYIVIFSIEEIILGIIGRLIWKRQFVKIAVACIKRMYPDKLKGKQIHVHFGEGSVPRDGPSAGVAIFMSILSAALNKPIMDKKPYDIAFTGELSLTGGVFAVGGMMEKIQAACDSGCTKVFIPEQNYDKLDEEKLRSFDCDIIPIERVSSLLEV